jgi:hypothetical protein
MQATVYLILYSHAIRGLVFTEAYHDVAWAFKADSRTVPQNRTQSNGGVLTYGLQLVLHTCIAEVRVQQSAVIPGHATNADKRPC